MVERLLARGFLGDCHYTAIDQQPVFIAHARARLPRWAEANHLKVETSPEGELRLSGSDGSTSVIQFQVADAREYIESFRGKADYDWIIAHAFLDLLDLDTIIPRLIRLLRPGGLVYFSLNFDGLTIFLPELDPGLDRRLVELYHRTMDERTIDGRTSGHSQTGRKLLEVLRRNGVRILEMGASDWVVRAPGASESSDESVFLRFIIQTVQTALDDHPELDRESLRSWIDERLAQIDRGDLVYLTHQLDYLGALE
jgi:SAM-dependent methyltransferase